VVPLLAEVRPSARVTSFGAVLSWAGTPGAGRCHRRQRCLASEGIRLKQRRHPWLSGTPGNLRWLRQQRRKRDESGTARFTATRTRRPRMAGRPDPGKAPEYFAPVSGAKYIQLTTFRRDGTAVVHPSAHRGRRGHGVLPYLERGRQGKAPSPHPGSADSALDIPEAASGIANPGRGAPARRRGVGTSRSPARREAPYPARPAHPVVSPPTRLDHSAVSPGTATTET
jgi:hypothetical protein